MLKIKPQNICDLLLGLREHINKTKVIIAQEMIIIRAQETIIIRAQETRFIRTQVTIVIIMVVNVEVKDTCNIHKGITTLGIGGPDPQGVPNFYFIFKL
jgi:hypothetical protein